MSPDGASVDAALEVLKWLPAEQAPSSLASLCALCPGLTEELLAAADPPLVVDHDPGAGGGGWPPPGRPFLRCDFSRDADSWRSPWTGAYFPPLADGAQPSPALRAAEVQANELFAAYVHAYYGPGAVGSVYLWEEAPAGDFGAAFLVHNAPPPDDDAGELQAGLWDAQHTGAVRCSPSPGGGGGVTASYTLRSSVRCSLRVRASPPGAGPALRRAAGDGSTSLSAALSRTAAAVVAHPAGGPAPPLAAHVAQLGRLLEESESRARAQVDTVLFAKTRQVALSHLRVDREDVAHRDKLRAAHAAGLIAEMTLSGGGEAAGGGGGGGSPAGGSPRGPKSEGSASSGGAVRGGALAGFDPAAALGKLRKASAGRPEGAARALQQPEPAGGAAGR